MAECMYSNVVASLYHILIIMDTVKVWTDGSCLNNGRVGAVCGLGAYYGNSDSRNYSSLLILDKQTNNRAELAAILYVVVMDFNEHNLLIHTDSSYSISSLTEYYHKWQSNGWVTAKGTSVESSDMIKFIIKLISHRKTLGLTTNFVHVKAHADNVNNNAVDKLARAGASKQSEGGRLMLLRKCGIPI